MGRHAGWLAAAAGLAGKGPDEAPHLILFPERPYDEAGFLKNVQKVVDRVGYCVVVASEGIQTADGRFVADSGAGKDSFGHTQLGGVASYLAGKVKDELGLKVHWTLPDYLQRSARHLASKTDVDQAIAVGKAAVQFALKGQNATMPVIVRTSDKPYRWKIGSAPLHKVANHEKTFPRSYIRRDGYGITDKARTYLEPLIRGEAPPPYGRDGIPAYVSLRNVAVKKKLPAWEGWARRAPGAGLRCATRRTRPGRRHQRGPAAAGAPPALLPLSPAASPGCAPRPCRRWSPAAHRP